MNLGSLDLPNSRLCYSYYFKCDVILVTALWHHGGGIGHKQLATSMSTDDFHSNEDQLWPSYDTEILEWNSLIYVFKLFSITVSDQASIFWDTIMTFQDAI